MPSFTCRICLRKYTAVAAFVPCQKLDCKVFLWLQTRSQNHPTELPPIHFLKVAKAFEDHIKRSLTNPRPVATSFAGQVLLRNPHHATQWIHVYLKAKQNLKPHQQNAWNVLLKLLASKLAKKLEKPEVLTSTPDDILDHQSWMTWLEEQQQLVA